MHVPRFKIQIESLSTNIRENLGGGFSRKPRLLKDKSFGDRRHEKNSAVVAILSPNSCQEMPLHLSIPRLPSPQKYLELTPAHTTRIFARATKNRRQRTPDFGISPRTVEPLAPFELCTTIHADQT
jgi:hypothetical protein